MNFQKQVVALVGPLGAGKDTITQYLVEHHSFQRFAFADEIKRNYYASSGYSEEQFKAARGTQLEKDIRAGLWQYSDRIKHEKGSLYFINIVVGAICDCLHSAVITDIRTHDELNAMRFIGAKIVLVLKVTCGTDLSDIRKSGQHLLIPGSRLSYDDINDDDKLFINYECADLEMTTNSIKVFCKTVGILE
jgi:hypothetical protein